MTELHGVAPPLVTPFTEDGALDEGSLRELVGWLGDSVDFVVPCGSTSEAELMTAEERARVVEVVTAEADVPVVAGTGSPGFEETRRATERAADAGVDAALVVTPFYYPHGDEALEAYYRDVADASPLPVYLYNVPAFTGVELAPEVAARLADHPNIAGMKDSSGDIAAFDRTLRLTRDADFDLLTGDAGIFAHSLESGGAGGILAIANLAPETAREVVRRNRAGTDDSARELGTDLAAINRTALNGGIPSLKAAMRARGAPAGHPRRPHRPVDEAVDERLREAVSAIPDV